MFSKLAFTLALVAPLLITVNAHGALTAIEGANGVTGQGFGIDPSTPRDCSKRNPCQQDTSIIRQNEVASGKASACGRTLEGGVNDIASQMAAASAAGLPSASADGTVSMTLHQVNGDGAGPYTCQVNADGTGQSFVAMTVTTNVPGKNSRSNAKATDFPLVAQMPPGTNCTGGPNGNACIVRCKNSAIAGPFGGCAAVTNAASSNNATAASSAAGGEAAAATAAGTAAETAAAGEGATAATVAGAAAETAAAGEASGAGSAETAAAGEGAAAATAAAGESAAPPAASAVVAGESAAPPAASSAVAAGEGAASSKAGADSSAAANPAAAKSNTAQSAGAGAAAPAAAGSGAESATGTGGPVQNAVKGILGGITGGAAGVKREVSEAEAEAALAKDLDRRRFGPRRVIKSRIVGTDRAFEWL